MLAFGGHWKSFKENPQTQVAADVGKAYVHNISAFHIYDIWHKAHKTKSGMAWK